jgi:hypothetical protein
MRLRTKNLPILLAACAAMCAGCGGASEDKLRASRPLVVLVSGDTAGWIVPCGCASNQSGGLPRRGDYVAKLRDKADVVVADAGGAASGDAPYDRAKFEAILQGELKLGVVAHNLGAAEVKLGAEYLRETTARLKVPFVSCNVADAAGTPIAEPVRLVTAGGRRLAIFGVLAEQFVAPGIQIAPPQSAILEAIERLKQSATIDSYVVLAYLPADELSELATALPEVDLVIGGPTGQSVAPRKVGPTQFASATNKGKFLAKFDWTAGGENDSQGEWIGEIVEMDAKLADDSAQQDNLRAFYAELARRDFTPAQTSFVAPVAAAAPPDFAIAGSDSCRKCHAKDCASWGASKHAAAWNTLTAKGAHVDSYCQQCHTTGFGQRDGFRSPTQTPLLTSVGCESCHGSSAAHVRDPQIRTPHFRKAASICTSCHDHDNSPSFAYEKYWPKITHGQGSAAATEGQELGRRETHDIQ